MGQGSEVRVRRKVETQDSPAVHSASDNCCREIETLREHTRTCTHENTCGSILYYTAYDEKQI